MRTLTVLFVLLISGGLFLASASAQTSGSHTVTMGISPISVIAVSGDPVPLIVQRDVPLDTGEAIDATTFYNLTTNVQDVMITAELDAPMPDGTSLFLTAESSLGKGNGETELSVSSRRLVTAIGRGLENGRILQYRFDGSRATTTIPVQSRRVTITIINPRDGLRQEVSQYVQIGVEAPLSDLTTN